MLVVDDDGNGIGPNLPENGMHSSARTWGDPFGNCSLYCCSLSATTSVPQLVAAAVIHTASYKSVDE